MNAIFLSFFILKNKIQELKKASFSISFAMLSVLCWVTLPIFFLYFSPILLQRKWRGGMKPELGKKYQKKRKTFKKVIFILN